MPGETIVVYATGCGPTNPPLVPGQVPAQGYNLATPPQATIGGLSATVTSATVMPGSPGMYKISIQVPTTTPDGDQEVVLQLGTATTVSTLLTVQK
jgi:uncharacterized protein (TIGR03437 family)